MKKTMIATALALAAAAATSSAVDAGGNKWGEVVPHGHVMLIGVEMTEEGPVWDRCVEFKALPVPAHHNSIHTGTPGGSPFAGGPLFQAGNWVIPLNPFAGLPFTGCDDIPNPLVLGG